MLPDEAVIEYQHIYKKLTGKDLAFNDAQEAANKLLNLVFLVEQTEMKNEKTRHSTLYAHS